MVRAEQVGRMHEAEPLLWRSASILEVAYGKVMDMQYG